MGMFAYVKHSAPCHNCGNMLGDWQTKDADELLLQRVSPEEIIGGVFYTACGMCNAWNQWLVKPPAGFTIVADHREPK